MTIANEITRETSRRNALSQQEARRQAALTVEHSGAISLAFNGAVEAYEREIARAVVNDKPLRIDIDGLEPTGLKTFLPNFFRMISLPGKNPFPAGFEQFTGIARQEIESNEVYRGFVSNLASQGVTVTKLETMDRKEGGMPYTSAYLTVKAAMAPD